MSDETKDAAQDILDAVRADDASALDLALQRHYELCEGGGDMEEEPPASERKEARY